ncbi:uncharacterized protein LOC112527358 isoform X2 [Cynara cardunculus var. scolymus]|uniref:uncharacterized protein LOC112527358 isoform X2 n=1 Tax=Cynara cardunculus var. scolymus TaxID=59895 RepID=UPI000D625A35|nr:uncharacterized protein LOC112527358 isoform X2 [Cynara cardunculus var. scolymus]
MFRFSCFHSSAHSQKPKKTVHLPTEAMQKTLEDHHTHQPRKDSIFLKEVPEGENTDPSQSSMVQDWNSEGPKSKNDIDSEDDHEIRRIRKSVSLGSGLAHYQEIAPGTGGSSSRAPCTPHAIVKSSSLPFLHLAHGNIVHHSRSSEDLTALGLRRNDKSVDNDDIGKTSPEQEMENDSVGQIEKTDGDDGEDAYDYVGLAKDWIVPAVDELGNGKDLKKDSSVSQWEELPHEDFRIKRIEKWVMDLRRCSSLEETNIPTNLDYGQNVKSTILDPVASSKNDDKAVLGMDAAKRYISSLSTSATAAQLTNHGLVVIPFLSAFSSLRALNLSGNSIVRITAGALPRGLHILNLSKNSISIIEGLRELTRLRVLDLSYNRILRIGHGLASCSSLKELYLAGNKISEVEGLHRLLKLNVLDLRFNKLSTTKSLGQLAANYNSLQAISLEGNPAQKNIGDEQLKKFLLGLLPHLSYFNRQSIKSGAVKDSADRAARLGISAHQIDRGLRSETKKSAHGRKSQPVAARGRHVRLPPSGVKPTSDRHHLRDVSPNLLSFRPDLAMRRTHSEGLLRAV